MTMGNYKTSKSIFISNLVRAALCLVLLLIVMMMVQGKIDSTFKFLGKNESVKAYSRIIYVEFSLIAVGAVLWWTGALTSRDGWRRFADQRSFPLSLVYCVSAFLIAGGTLCFAPGIYDVNNYLHRLWYGLTAPLVFSCLLYGVVPMSMREVILPCKHCGAVRCVICIATAVLAILILMR